MLVAVDSTFAAAGAALGLTLTAVFLSRRRLISQTIVGRRPTFSVVGDTFADIMVGMNTNTLPNWGTDVIVDWPIQVRLGGSASNVAAHLTGALSQGLVTKGIPRGLCTLHSAIGHDEFGDIMRGHLKKRGIAFCETKTRTDQGACIVLSGPKDRCFITHRGGASTVCAADLQVEEIQRSDHVHVAGFFNMPAMAKDVTTILRAVRRNGGTTSLNFQYDASEKWEVDPAVFPEVSVILTNEMEALKITRAATLERAAAYFIKRGVELVVITRGQKGVMAAEGEGMDYKCWQQNCKQVPVVDTTGGGDAFAAGFLCSWKITGDVQQALKWGTAYGTAVCQFVGASQKEHLTTEQLQQYMVD